MPAPTRGCALFLAFHLFSLAAATPFAQLAQSNDPESLAGTTDFNTADTTNTIPFGLLAALSPDANGVGSIPLSSLRQQLTAKNPVNTNWVSTCRTNEVRACCRDFLRRDCFLYDQQNQHCQPNAQACCAKVQEGVCCSQTPTGEMCCGTIDPASGICCQEFRLGMCCIEVRDGVCCAKIQQGVCCAQVLNGACCPRVENGVCCNSVEGACQPALKGGWGDGTDLLNGVW